MILRSTKSYYNLPVAHMQWFDTDESGEACTGPCSKWHGYDRSVHFEFSGEADEHGWIVGFGDLRPVKAFLEYYFDHTALISADDPRMEAAMAADKAGIVDLRILPYGVSMEMSSIFVWENVNPFIYKITDGRACITKIEFREHQKNAGQVVIDYAKSMANAKLANDMPQLVMESEWKFEEPAIAVPRILDRACFYVPTKDK